jgi:hypothetical protein
MYRKRKRKEKSTACGGEKKSHEKMEIQIGWEV